MFLVRKTDQVIALKRLSNPTYTMEIDTYYMQICLALAQQAGAKGNAAVGSIVVCNNTIISKAEEAEKIKNDVTCHAEVEAIRQAVGILQSNDLSGCILYSTHEPCIMCSYSIRFHKINRVVYQHSVKYLGGVSSSMPLLTSTDVPPNWSGPPVILHLNKLEE